MMLGWLFKRRRAKRVVPEWAKFLPLERFERLESLVGDEVARLGGDAVEVTSGTVRIKLPGDEKPLTMGLQNLAQHLAATDDDAWPTLIERHFTLVTSGQETQRTWEEVAGDYERAAEMLRLRLFPIAYTEEGRGLDMVWRVDLPGVASVVVIDFPQLTQTLTRKWLEKWNKSADQVLERAKRNTLASGAMQVERVPLDEEEQLVIRVLLGEDHYLATHALDLPSYPGLIGTHGSMVMVPNRHAVMVFPIEHIDVVKVIPSMIGMGIKLYTDGPGSISDQMYWRDAAGEFHRLDTKIVEGEGGQPTLDITPPERFVTLLNQLAPPASA